VAIGLERERAQDLASQVEAAKQSERLRTTLLGAMAHEFKTPLTSVMAATSSLLEEPDQPRELRIELTRIADEEAKHLKELIDDSIEMGRLDSANIDLMFEQASMPAIVQEVVTGMQPDIDTREVTVSSDKSLPPIAMDRRLVRLAIKQLLDNALKYSPDNQPITIHVHEAESMVSVDVTDRGPGIPPQELNRIFDRLYRSPSVAREVPGSGLGLSIAQNIARAHHGDLTVTSREGETIFSLNLPLEQTGNHK
jgi:two-component system sensor histidine kinase KdpD